MKPRGSSSHPHELTRHRRPVGLRASHGRKCDHGPWLLHSPTPSVPILYYVHDPMCSWCYAFAPAMQRIEAALPASLRVDYLLGGLAPDTDQSMPPRVREYIQQTWRRIQTVVPGTEFNFEFWTRCTPRRSTYPACRAVLAAKHFDPVLERPMIGAIQRAYYREARNPSELGTLCALASEIGLDREAFGEWLTGEECETLLTREIATARRLGVAGFPTLVLSTDDGDRIVPHSLTDPQPALLSLEHLLDS